MRRFAMSLLLVSFLLPVLTVMPSAEAGQAALRIGALYPISAVWRCWGRELAGAEIARQFRNQKAAWPVARSSSSGRTCPT